MKKIVNSSKRKSLQFISNPKNSNGKASNILNKRFNKDKSLIDLGNGYYQMFSCNAKSIKSN